MSNVLHEIIAANRPELERRRAQRPLAELIVAGEQRRAGAQPFRDFHGALAAPGLSVIAEHKRSSPSAGLIRGDLTLADVVSSYERGGAAALSILTEPTRFGGSLEDLRAARQASTLPILRKDFVVDEYQIHEALADGADAVLLIVAALEPGPLAELQALARSLGLATLVEVHEGAELDRALALDGAIIGINNRNLSTLDVDIERCFELRSRIPAGRLCVAESGFKNRADAVRLAEAGFNAVLIGETLMRSDDLAAACREFSSGA